MRTPPLRLCLTLLLASGGCLLGSAPRLGAPALAQTLPPQGVPNTTGATTPDGPVDTTSTTSSSPTSTNAQPTSTPTGASTTAAPAGTTGASSASSSPAGTSTQTGASSPITPAPSGTPSVSTTTVPPANGTASSAAAGPSTTAPGAASAGALDGDTIYLLNADLLRLTGEDTAVLTGNVEVRYRDYTLYADRAVVNTDTGRVVFDGNVRVISSVGNTTIAATSPQTRLFLDSRNNTYSVEGPQHAVIDPSLFAGSGLVLPLRVDTNDATSINSILDARQGGFTTCDFLHPHYLIGVRSLTIVPGKKLVARHAILYRRGRRIAELPYLIVPLNNRYDQASYLPLVGDDPYEGVFVKFAVPYALAGDALGVLHLDYMSNIGTGTGFDQSYQAHGPGGNGDVSLYRLDNRASGLTVLTGSLVQDQTIGNFKLGINTSYENNSYESAAGASTNFSGAINLAGTEGRNTTLFTSNLQQSNYGEGLTSNLTASLNQLQHLGGLNTFGIKLNYTNSEDSLNSSSSGFASSSSGKRSTLGSDFDLHLQPDGLKIDLQTDLFSTLQNSNGSSLDSLAGLQRRPELMLTTTGTGDDPLDDIAHLVRGSQIQLGFGQYVETHSVFTSNNTPQIVPFSDDRLYFSYDGGNQVRRTGDFTLTSDSSYQQAFYSDGGAQYLLDGRYGSQYMRGPLTLGANYTTLRAYGFTPFLFDRPGDYNNANFTVGYSPNKDVTYSGATAYNFLQDRGVYDDENGVNTLVIPAAPWQNLIGIVNVHPSQLLNDQFQATYDLNKQALFDVTNSFYAANKAGFGFRNSLDYLPQQNRFGLINSALDLPIILDQREQAGYKIQAIAGYDGLTDKFTYQGLALTRSWHDFELTATYQNNPESFGTQSNTFSLTFHLKALPGYQPFGVGSSGQSLTGGIGAVY